MRKCWVVIAAMFLIVACGEEETKPKPRGFLALDYPEAQYKFTNFDCPYNFEINTNARVKPSRNNIPCWIDLEYKNLKGTIFVTYQPVHGNLDSLLTDAQNLPLQHTIKADGIEGDIYTNPKRNVYGMFYEVSGDAASQAQFYLTDSINHFLTASAYFKTKPNYDSIVPAAAYLKKDMKRMIETMQWQDKTD
ncbi:protein involved in gliding motility GldD [Salegentibacter echinorum]|uniref:Protein involved in gliding motility GldD n=1 Tax=Salegentibacter echinorum TaxID=1073325 RepID=A0A1M5G604_SALEC|nr:gliding motility lipoprotein GldD [Salegentibacter echinorum]SHF99163.1 protein involved in gliding motility GldD [Salegentibacter echinorum]